VTARDLRALLRRHGLAAGRRLGQHFLADPSILQRIASAADAGAQSVLEVGPGVGVLTRELLARGAEVTAVELDRNLRPALLEVLAAFVGPPSAGPVPERAGPPAAEWLGPRLRLIWGDAVRLPWQRLAEERRRWRVCSNLPYYITGPFLAALLDSGLEWTTAVLLVQAEVARRLRAPAGTPEYGALTCLVAYHADVQTLFPVPRSAFLPPPAVDSAVVRLVRRPPPVAVPAATLRRVVRAAFAQRRKMLRNALAAALPAEAGAVGAALEAAGIAASRRGETLTLEEFGRLAEALQGAGLLPAGGAPGTA
jgi:16S rRNA (adenine1518-N6/adenine1519-N6)-dimethyltransferase